MKDHPSFQEDPSALQREHAALQNMKLLHFLWVVCPPGSGSETTHFPNADPDKPTKTNADPVSQH
jgi:hypothetical protein